MHQTSLSVNAYLAKRLHDLYVEKRLARQMNMIDSRVYENNRLGLHIDTSHLYAGPSSKVFCSIMGVVTVGRLKYSAAGEDHSR